MAGLGDPAYALLLGLCLVLLVSWPQTLRLRKPQQVAELSSRSRLWRWLLTPSPLTSWQATGLRPLTAMTLAVALSMVAGSASYEALRARNIRQQGGRQPGTGAGQWRWHAGRATGPPARQQPCVCIFVVAAPAAGRSGSAGGNQAAAGPGGGPR